MRFSSLESSIFKQLFRFLLSPVIFGNLRVVGAKSRKARILGSEKRNQLIDIRTSRVQICITDAPSKWCKSEFCCMMLVFRDFNACGLIVPAKGYEISFLFLAHLRRRPNNSKYVQRSSESFEKPIRKRKNAQMTGTQRTVV